MEMLCQGDPNEETCNIITKKINTTKYNSMRIPNTVLATIRTDGTNRQAAAITSGYIKDLIAAEVLRAGGEYLALDQFKIHWARDELMVQVQEEHGIA